MAQSSRLSTARPARIPLLLLLRLSLALKKSVFSRHFYQEVNEKVLSKADTLDATLYFICYFTLLLSSLLDNKGRLKAFLAKQTSLLARVTGMMTTRAGLVAAIKRDDANSCGQRPSKGSQQCQNTVLDTEKTKESTDEVSDPADESEKVGQISEESEKAGQIPEDTKETSIGTPHIHAASIPSKTAVHLKAISSYIADVRIFNRLVESIRYMPWIIDEFSALMNPALAVPRLDRLVNFGQSINCLILELLENAGWLTEHNWVATSDNNYWCIETYVWCSRVWGAYIVVEIIELFRRVPSSKRNKDWRINLFTQLVQLPLVVHWSLHDGCLNPFWVGLCGSAASWFNFRNTWGLLDLA